MSARGARIDWSWGPGHGPASGAVNAAGATLGVTMVASLAGVPAWYPAVAGCLAALGAALAAGIRGASPRVLWYRAGCWVGAGAWSGATLAWSSPWATRPLAALAGGVLVLATLGGECARAERRTDAAAREAEVFARSMIPVAARDALGREWEQRLADVCHIHGAVVQGISEWEGGYGYTVDVLLPRNGSTWRHVKMYESGLASNLRLPEGCGVEARAGADRGSALLYVSVRNALLEDFPYTDDVSVDTVNNPRCFGVFRDGSRVLASTRQDCALFVGQAGSGKTNLMNVAIAEHLKCNDVIVCVIDFNGGGLALPWLMAWQEVCPESAHPPIGWVASTPDEALLMTDWLLRVAVDRKSSYAAVKRAANVTLLPVGPKIPEFVLFVDEVAEILGTDVRDRTTRRVGDNLSKIIRIGRDSGFRTVISGLSATSSTIGRRENRALSRIRSAMRGQDKDEFGYLFGTYRLDTALALAPGTGFWQVGDSTGVRPYRVPLLLPAQITEIVRATADRRPGPDARALAVDSDGVWAGRWKRAAELLEQLGATEMATAGATSTDTTASPPPSLPQALRGLSEARDRMRDAAERARRGDGDSGPVLSDDDWAKFDELLKNGESKVSDVASVGKETAREFIRRVVGESGEAGMTANAVIIALQRAGYVTAYPTMSRWLREDVTAGILAQPGGLRTAYTKGPRYPL